MSIAYVALGWLKHSERDNYFNGCDPKTGNTIGGQDAFNNKTIDGLIKDLMFFTGCADPKAVLLDSCEEASRIDIQVYETHDGLAASEADFQKFKHAGIDLWLCTYTFNVLEARKIVVSRTVKDKKLYANA